MKSMEGNKKGMMKGGQGIKGKREKEWIRERDEKGMMKGRERDKEGKGERMDKKCIKGDRKGIEKG